MIELSNDPTERKKEVFLMNFIQERRHKLGNFCDSSFRSDFDEVVKETITGLEAELELWKTALVEYERIT